MSFKDRRICKRSDVLGDSHFTHLRPVADLRTCPKFGVDRTVLLVSQQSAIITWQYSQDLRRGSLTHNFPRG